MLGDIKEIIKQAGKSVPETALAAGMSQANLYRQFKQGTIQAVHLKKIADFLEIPITAFFGEEHESIGDRTAFVDNKGQVNYMHKNKGSVNQSMNVGGDFECRKELEKTKAKLEEVTEKYIKLLESR